MKKRSFFLSLIGLFTITLVAYAAVIFNPETGEGFVGKGDVQLVYGWNNAQLQSNGAGVSFTYETDDVYTATCTWMTGQGKGEKTHNINLKRHTGVNSAVAYDTRRNALNMITGFNLTGFGATTDYGTVPVEGGACVGNEEGINHNGKWTEVSLSSSTGGLFVNHGGMSFLLLAQ